MSEDEEPREPVDPRVLYLPFAGPLLGYPLMVEVRRIGPRGFQPDDRALHALSLLAGLALWVLALRLALAHQRRNGYSGWGIALFAFLWLFAMPGWPYAAGRYLNRALDSGPAAPLTARVTAKPWSPQRRLTYYWLSLQLPDGRTFDLPVQRPMYGQAAVDGAVVLYVRPGAFGWPWVADAEVPPR